jgi:hypothetical protein
VQGRSEKSGRNQEVTSRRLGDIASSGYNCGDRCDGCCASSYTPNRNFTAHSVIRLAGLLSVEHRAGR